MATLDDKLLGEKLHYYCSSSEDEGSEDEAGAGARSRGPQQAPASSSQGQGQAWDGSSANTGPKGVLKDWQRYKQLETEMRCCRQHSAMQQCTLFARHDLNHDFFLFREEAEMEKINLAKKLALTCRSTNDDDKAKQKEEAVDKELEELLDDGFLESYMQQRMREMMDKTQNTQKKFGKVIELHSGDSFLDAVDMEDKKVTVMIFVHEPGVEGCQAMSGCLDVLASEYVTVKFCKILSSAAGLSKHFKLSGVPALIIYRAGAICLTQ